MTASKLLGAFSLVGLVSMFTAGCAVEQTEEEIAESEDRLLAGRRLSPSEVALHLRNAGFPENQIGRMVCTAKYESSFYEEASNNNKNGSKDRGLFQINSIHLGSMKGCPSKSNASALNDAATNAECALAIFEAQGNNAWYGYRKHKTECNSYPAPASAKATGSSSSGSSGASEEEPEETGTNASGGGCWSGTLQDMMDAGTCVQSSSNGVWMQCNDGQWYRGGNSQSGPFGDCNGSYPL